MKANETSFSFIGEESLIEIPFFQRKYVWTETQWKQLFDDLLESHKSGKEHFLGSILLKQLSSNAGQGSRRSLIDGQQRLTTFSILLKSLYDYLNDDDKVDYVNYLYQKPTKEKQPKIKHSKLDRISFNQVLSSKSSKEMQNKINNKIIQCYKYFSSEIDTNIENKKEFLDFILRSKFWVIINLEDKEDEQKIFDSINTTGLKLNATDIIKNALFDKAIKLLGEEKVLNYYQKYWEDIFEKDNEEREFWGKEFETGRVKRSRSEILFHAFAIIKSIFDPEKHSLSNLSSLYKDYIENINANELEDLLKEIAEYAKIYRQCPQITKEEMLVFEDWEKRFFHTVEVFNISVVLPLVIYLKHRLKDNDNLYKECLYLLEILILCNSQTKDYNKFFAKLIKDISKKSDNEILNIIRQDTYGKYGDCLSVEYIEWRLNNIKNNNNNNAKFILFWIELFRQYKEKNYKDKVGLQYIYTLEHLMPQTWQTHWQDIGKDEENAEKLIYQIGNMTLVKGKLNSALQNHNWDTKLNGDGKSKNFIKKNADLIITRELFDIKEWNEAEIRQRTEELTKDFLEIWNVDIFKKKLKSTINNLRE